MKKLLLPLSCLLALSACWRNTRPQEPDWDPARDIPAGTLVRVTLQDVNDPRRISTFVVDPRTGRVLERRDGAKAVAQDEALASGATQAAATTQTVSTAVQVPCPEIPRHEDDPACLVYASDPKHETTGDPNPIMPDYKERLALTEKFVQRVAVNLMEAAHVTGVTVGVQKLEQAPR